MIVTRYPSILHVLAIDMPHYIRFLKPPQQVPANRGLVNVDCLITITNDLGDEFLWETVPLTAILLVENAKGCIPLVKKELDWESGRRDVKITFGSMKPVAQSSNVRVYVAMGPDADANGCTLSESGVPPVIAAWSARFGGCYDAKAKKLVERRFHPGSGPPIAIWEETGESIARHLW